MDELWQQQIEETEEFAIKEMEYEMEQELLQQRGSTHGNFQENSSTVQHLKIVMREGDYYLLPDYMKEALDMIQHKIGRILHGDPFLEDHWKDIVGYAQLVVDTMKKDEKTTFIEQKKYKVDDNGVRYEVH